MNANKRIPDEEAVSYVSVKTISAFLTVKEKTIYKLVETGQIPHYRIGKLIRFKIEEVSAWMNSKKAVLEEKQVDKLLSSLYSKSQGRPSRLGKGVQP